jgi:hypothetical protein
MRESEVATEIKVQGLTEAHGLLWQAYTRPSSLSPALVNGVRVHCGMTPLPGASLPSANALAEHMQRLWGEMAEARGWRHVPLKKNFNPRRRASGHEAGQVIWHWTGGAGDAVRLGNFWNGGDRQASSHAGVDEHGVCWYIHPLWTTWHVPGHNSWSIGVDICAPPKVTQRKAAEARGIYVGDLDSKWLKLDPRIAEEAGKFRKILDVACPQSLSPSTHRWLTPKSRPEELLPWEPDMLRAGAIDATGSP